MNTDGKTESEADGHLLHRDVAIVEDQRKFVLPSCVIDAPKAFAAPAAIVQRRGAGQNRHDLPDVVLMDIGLPGLSGIEVLVA